MEKFAAFIARLFLTAAFISMTAPAAPKIALAPTPPQPVEQKVTVKRGGSVDIPLRIYGTRAQTLSWIIRQQPAHGRLSGVRATAPETAVITYRPPADLRIVSDRFTFSARSNEGVSAAAEVTISIIDDEPQLSVPAEMNFGELLTGASAGKMLEFKNGGGGIAEGAIEVDAPWRLEGARRYRLPAGARHIVKIVFAPERAGKFESEVRFTSQPDRAVALLGVAVEPLTVAPAALTLAQDRGQPLRAASFELRNHTDAPLDVALAASPRLILPATLNLPPHGMAAVSVRVAETDIAPLDETIHFTAGALSAELQVKADALPALVRAQPRSVVFRRMDAGAIAHERVLFENRGGRESKVTLAAGAPFSIGEKSFTLAPGAEKEIIVTLAAATAGSAEAVLKVAADGGGFDIPLSAEISPLSAGPSAPRSPPASVRAPQSSEESDEPAGIGYGPYAATIVSAGENTATFSWKDALPPDAKLRCMIRSLTLGEDDALISNYREYPACHFAQREGERLATVEKLEPGKTYHFRIDALSDDSATQVTFAQIRTPEPPPSEPVFTLTRVLIALALLAAGASLWQRARDRRDIL